MVVELMDTACPSDKQYKVLIVISVSCLPYGLRPVCDVKRTTVELVTVLSIIILPFVPNFKNESC